MLTLLIFLAVLAILVLSHEFGHFIVARKSGMKVYEFGFGFPPRLFKYTSKKSGVMYSFNLIPLGGFVKIKGEDADETGPDSFGAQKMWKRAITLFAGVGMNVVLAAVLLSIGFAVGMPQAVDSFASVEGVKDRQLQIAQVISGKPAEAAGLKPGDSITRLDAIEQPRLKQMQEYVAANKDKEISVTVKRGTETITKKIKPFVYESGRAGIGVGLAEIGTVKYPWYKAISEGILATGYYLKEIVLAFYLLIRGLFAGEPVGEAVSGPVGIAVMTGQVARMGWAYMINFVALLSLNLAIINILPIPALDGGRLLFLGLSKILRRPITPRYEQVAHTVGFVLLMLLVVLVTVKDIGRFSGAIGAFFQKIF
ncbi:RIP metalloprotease RseP [Patescibacteria group bacterium]|nr:MAG: RIP metalloprotease RseP [Patescibacteria group bacterium]